MKISDSLQTGMDVKTVNPMPVPSPPEEKTKTENPPVKNIPSLQQTDEESGAPSRKKKLSREETEELVEALEDLAETIQTKLNFSVNETTNDIVVKIMDKETETVIKQFPSEELLELQEKMIDLSGFLFDQDV